MTPKVAYRMGFFGNIGNFFKKSFKSLSNPVKYLGDLGSALMGKDAFSDYDGSLGVLGNLGGTIQDFWKDYTGQTIAEKNLDAQQKQWELQNDLNERQFEYQQTLNAQQQEREDTAMQRKVADLKAAGLNPVLAANGTGAPSAALSAPALKAPSAPHLDDYSSGARESLSQLSSLVLNAISMKKDFAMKDAQIKLFQAEKDKIDAEAAGIKTENNYKDDWFRLKNENLELENKLKSGTLQSNIDLAKSKLSISKKEELIKNMEMMLYQDKHVLNKIDIEIQKLVKEGKITENDILNKKLELLTTECLQKSLDLSNAEWDTNWYHNRNLPVDFNAGWMGQLGLLISGLGEQGVNLIIDYFSGILGVGSSNQGSPKSSKSQWQNALKKATVYPRSSSFTFDSIMRSKFDYGVRRNH